jgi:hypothetical protein
LPLLAAVRRDFSFSHDCGFCGNTHDMTCFDHDLDKFVCDEWASDPEFATAALLGTVEVVEPYRPKIRKA